jgi:hypothetical protein
MPPLPPPCYCLRTAVAAPLPRWCCRSAATNTTLLLPHCRCHSASAANALPLLIPPYCSRAAAAALPPPLCCCCCPRADTTVAVLLLPPPLCCIRCHRCPAALPPHSLLPLSCRCAPTNNAPLPPRCHPATPFIAAAELPLCAHKQCPAAMLLPLPLPCRCHRRRRRRRCCRCRHHRRLPCPRHHRHCCRCHCCRRFTVVTAAAVITAKGVRNSCCNGKTPQREPRWGERCNWIQRHNRPECH